MAGHMPRSSGSLHVQSGLIGLRAPQPSTDSPSSMSLTGLAGLEAAQGSLTSNALFGSLNLVRITAIHVLMTQHPLSDSRSQTVLLSWGTILAQLGVAVTV
jgi:hypothetical protein